MHSFIQYLEQLGPYEAVGVAGFICYIAAFGAVQLDLMDGNQTPFTLLNILAACLVGISLIAEFNLASALIQGSWILIGLTSLCLRGYRRLPPRQPSATSTPTF